MTGEDSHLESDYEDRNGGGGHEVEPVAEEAIEVDDWFDAVASGEWFTEE
jgi:hypothetical protein